MNIEMNLETEKEVDPRIDLAVERTQLALERTHLAWIRTTFAIMTAGIAIDKGLAIIHEQRLLRNEALIKNGHAAGLFLTSFGTLLLLVETLEYIKRSKQLAAMKMTRSLFFLTNVVLAFLVFLLGVVLIYLMLLTG